MPPDMAKCLLGVNPLSGEMEREPDLCKCRNASHAWVLSHVLRAKGTAHLSIISTALRSREIPRMLLPACILKYVHRRVTNPRESGEGDDVNVKLPVDWNDDSSTKYIQVGKVANDSQQASLKCFRNGAQAFIFTAEH